MIRPGARNALAIALAIVLAACSSSDDAGREPDAAAPPPDPPAGPTDEEQRQKAVSGMHDVLLADLEDLAAATAELATAAPAPKGRGWDPVADQAAIAAMRAAWIRARTAYEHVEGALAPLFPDIDYAIDARYDDFVTDLAGSGGDDYLFDGTGVTGMHAVERILFIDTTPASVVELEETLPGYVPAAIPATEKEAADFKDALAARLVSDTKTLLDEWTPANIDVRIAYDGLASLVAEQFEKVQKAATSEEESRYSQRTMADLRDNLAGARKGYAVFQPWIRSKGAEGADRDEKILAGFDALAAAYGAVGGDAIPAPPPTWSAEHPSQADLATPFGKLYSVVDVAVDPANPGSIVAHLEGAGRLLGFTPPK